MRIGLGYDIHRLTAGRPLYLGGLRVPYAKGLLGHSDGDVVIHAVIDALLGAAGEGDIGRLFPDTDPRFKDIRSVTLLAEVVSRLRKRKLRVDHVDVVIVAEFPRLGSSFEKMKRILGPLLGLPADRLGLKAKTNEGLGETGRGRAIACLAVASLRSVSSRAR